MRGKNKGVPRVQIQYRRVIMYEQNQQKNEYAQDGKNRTENCESTTAKKKKAKKNASKNCK